MIGSQQEMLFISRGINLYGL